MRLKDKIAIVVGAGQSPGSTPAIGNGRATSILFAREGARVFAVNKDLPSVEETVAMIRKEKGSAEACEADVTDEASVKESITACVKKWGRVDILHYNVGISVEGKDAPVTEITTEAFDRIVQVNLRGFVYACKHALPVMRKQKKGVILSISSMAAVETYPWVAYKATKSAMIAMTEQLAIQNAEHGIRANVILPGLMAVNAGIDRLNL